MKTSAFSKLTSATCWFTVCFAATASGYYNPGNGRWLSRDPVGEYGGANAYAFVENAPTT